ncbi:MAG: CDP-alcohol phosphatidyltransferase family protein [Actinocatenispora sp.]
MTVATPTGTRPSAADFYAVNRGGGLVTEQLNQRLAARVAVLSERLGVTPTALTAGNLVLGLATSVAVILTAGPVAAGRVPAWLVGVLAFVVWHAAYTLDCADGQLARVTGASSPAGARVDVLADVALQISLVAAVSAVGVAQRPSTPTWLVAAFAASWMVNLVTSVMAKEGANASLVTSSSLPVRIVKLIRDYGAMLVLIGVVLAAVPAWTIWLMVLFTAVNGLFLLASIAAAGRASLRAPSDR